MSNLYLNCNLYHLVFFISSKVYICHVIHHILYIYFFHPSCNPTISPKYYLRLIVISFHVCQSSLLHTVINVIYITYPDYRVLNLTDLLPGNIQGIRLSIWSPLFLKQQTPENMHDLIQDNSLKMLHLINHIIINLHFQTWICTNTGMDNHKLPILHRSIYFC